MPRQKFSRKPCPDQDALAKAFLDEADIQDIEPLIDHVLVCPACRAKFDILLDARREFRKDEPEWIKQANLSFKELRASSNNFGTGNRRGWLGANRARWATGLVLIAILIAAAYFLLVPPAQDWVLQSASKNDLRLLEPHGSLKRPPAVFKWTPVKNAEKYVFELINNDLQTVVQTEIITATDFSMPAEVQEKIVRGKTYIWSVEVYDDEGIKIDSGQQYFEIR